MDKVELARNLVKRGAAVSRALRLSEEVDDSFVNGHPLYEQTADALSESTTQFGIALDEYESLEQEPQEQQEQHVA